MKDLGDIGKLQKTLFPVEEKSATSCLLRDWKKKPREKAERVLQFATHVAFCNRDSRGESVTEGAIPYIARYYQSSNRLSLPSKTPTKPPTAL